MGALINRVFPVLIAWSLFPATMALGASTPAEDPMVSPPPAPSAPAPKKGLRLLPIPLVAYKDPYGFVGGVGLVLFDPRSQTRLNYNVNLNFKDYHRFRLKFDYVRPGRWLGDLDSFTGKDVQLYHGEGDQTPTVHETLRCSHKGSRLVLLRRAAGKCYVGPWVEYRFRRWEEKIALDPSIFPTESLWRFGLQGRWEARDSQVEPRRGVYAEGTVSTSPRAGRRGVGAGVWQVEGDFRRYHPVSSRGTVAVRLDLGTTWGDASYSFRRSLGGTAQLRGFRDNRFRGKRFYCLQAEWRQYVWRSMGFETGFELGDATDGPFETFPRACAHLGLRSNVLSRYGVILRADVAASRDSSTFSFHTLEAF